MVLVETDISRPFHFLASYESQINIYVVIQAVRKVGASAEEVNETNLDLNLGLKTRDGDNGSDVKMGEGSDQLER